MSPALAGKIPYKPYNRISLRSHIIEYHSVIKGNKTVPFAEMWVDLENVIQSEVSQKEKQISYANTYVESRKTV